MKHPLRRISESGFLPINSHAGKGMRVHPDKFDDMVAGVEAAEREKRRLGKEYPDLVRRFLDEFQRLLEFYGSGAELPLRLLSPKTGRILVSSSSDIGKDEMKNLIEKVRAELSLYEANGRFPFRVIDTQSNETLLVENRFPFRLAIQAFWLPTKGSFRESVQHTLRGGGV